MTNRFKNLDTTQLSAGFNPHGEVVTVIIQLSNYGTFVSSYQRKMKDYSRSAATNAFLMHRSLCRGFSDENRWVPENRTRSVKRIFGDAVQLAYTLNDQTKEQHFRFTLELSNLELYYENVNGMSVNPSIWSDTFSQELVSTIFGTQNIPS